MTHIVQTQAERRRAGGRALERVREVVRLVHFHVSPKCDEAGEHDEHEHEDLEHAEEVLQAQAPLQREAVQEEGEGDACESDETERPAGGLDISGE